MQNRINLVTQKGMTILEILVALFLGLLLISFSLPTFMVSFDIYKTTKALARTDEVARFATTVLSKDLRNAGFRGCDSGSNGLVNNGLVNITGNTLFDSFSRMSAMNRSANESIVGVESTVTLKNATDAITISSLQSSNAFLSSDSVSSSTQITLNNVSEFSAGDIVYIGDCRNSVLASISSIAGNTITLNQAPGAIFTSGTYIYRYESTTYFVALSQLYINNLGQTPHSLWRKVNGGASEELVAGIEDLQFSYGLDTDDDGTANQFVIAPSDAQISAATIIRFKITSSSLDAPDANGVVEKSVSKSVNLRNG